MTGTFPLLTEVLSNSEIGLPGIKAVLTAHLDALDTQFETSFRDVSDDEGQWIRAPFSKDDISNTNLSCRAQDQQVDLSCDCSLKVKFRKQSLTAFLALH